MKMTSGGIKLFACALSGGVALSSGCAGKTSTDDYQGYPTATPIDADAGPFQNLIGSGGSIAIDGGPVGFCPPEATPPTFGTPVTCKVPPPPISGGTLLITHDGSKAVAADPDRDAVYVVDLASKTLASTIALQPGDEPGRLAEDGAGRIHVALRGSGTLATIDLAMGAVTARRSACPAPRGVAWQASSDVVWVACATGELASLPAAGGAATVQHVQRDLRDVLISGDSIAVTQFRSSQVLRLASDDVTVARTDTMPSPMGDTFTSHVLWRAVQGPSGTLVAVHQAETTQSVSTTSSGGYGCGIGGPLGGFPGFSGADASPVVFGDQDASPPPPPLLASFPGLGGSPVTSVLTVLGSDGTVSTNETLQAVLPVDVASSSDGSLIGVVAAGSGSGSAATLNVFLFQQSGGGGTTTTSATVLGQPTAIAIDANDDVLVQTREPAALTIGSVDELLFGDAGALTSIPLSSVSRYDTGHDIFHTHAGSLIACASCHPEGGDDGHTWLLDDNQRRTPSMRGTIAGTAPYHWPGDEANFTSIVNDVYKIRMSGGDLSTPQIGALTAWVEGIPAPRAPTWVDATAAATGRALFERSDVGCATCHSGSKFTNNATVDVGTGGSFQVPPLVGVGWRTPLMHDGCAATIADRFGSCSTPGHGNIASLSTGDVANLTAYLETL
jgi:hypothetical protein